MEEMPAWMRIMSRADPWVVVIGGLLLFFLLRSVVHRLIYFLAQNTVVGLKAIWEFVSRRGEL